MADEPKKDEGEGEAEKPSEDDKDGEEKPAE